MRAYGPSVKYDMSLTEPTVPLVDLGHTLYILDDMC